MKKAYKHVLIVLLGVMVAGCNLLGGTTYDDAVETQINGTEFSYAAAEPIYASFTNISGTDLYTFWPVNSYLKVLNNGKWESLGIWYSFPGIGPYPRLHTISLPDGDSIDAPTLMSDSEVLEVGKTYRIAVYLYHTKDFENPVFINQRTTKPFTILP